MSLKPEKVDFDVIWTRLRHTIASVIILSKVDRQEWNERFSDVYKLCVACPEPLCDRLYNETRAFLNEHVINLCKTIVANAPNGELLVAYHQQWLVYKDGVNYMNKLYWYLNTQHVKKQKYSEADLSYGCVEVNEQLKKDTRSRKCLQSSCCSRVTSECESRMIADHLQFLHSQCKAMVLQNRRRDLQNMYKLLKPVEAGLPTLVKEVQEHITQIGLNAVTSLDGENIAQAFVENILDVHKENSQLIKDVFHCDQQFVGALDKACALVINHRSNPKQPCKSPELLARYCDSLLKKSSKGMNETEIDEKLTQSVTVFKYIDDKDVFQKFYSKMLAKRLIHTQSVSMDAEEAMINKLKQACGHEFTSKLHRMFTDIKLSDDLN
ncbi:cullin-2-like protein, partial [Leptotrombidium deliense]